MPEEHKYDLRGIEMKEALSAFRSRVHNTGQYENFRKLADRNRANGMPARTADVAAAKYFPCPIDQMHPTELPLWGYKLPSHLSLSEARKTNKAIREGEESLAEAVQNKPLLKGIRDEAQEQAFEDFLCQNVPLDKKCPEKEAVSWAITRKHTSAAAITVEEVPSRLALVLWIEARHDQEFMLDLIKKHLDKALPSKTQMEYEAAFMDDGRRLGNFIEKAMMAVEHELAEGLEAEPAVPPEG
jgi:hypothetical protein